MEPIEDAELSTEELAEVARARASFYSFLNLHFTTLPDATFVGQIRAPEFTSVLETLAADEDLNRELASGAQLMRSYIQSTLNLETEKMAEALGVDRTRLYRGVAPGYGPPPPYEAVWNSEAGQETGVLQVIAALYRESGLALGEETHERIDYIGVEMDYMHQLATREAEAWQSDDDESALKIASQERDFLDHHLGAWAPAFADKALEMAETDMYRGHLHMVRGFLADEKERLQYLVEDHEEEES